jgi:hypothetical protein
VPALAATDRASDPIDAFIIDRLHRDGLSLAPPSDRLTLVRRATLDLTGLPPTPEEIDVFLADRSPLAYERLIDRLLASPHHGERWGRHWLDVARFSESHGFEYNHIRAHAWRYRDYVIASLNADLPYTRFVRKLVAGDVLEPDHPRVIAAIGFLVAGPFDEANQVQKSVTMRLRVREEELEDMVSAVGQTFLGLTINCARCHDLIRDLKQRGLFDNTLLLWTTEFGRTPFTEGIGGKGRDHHQRAFTCWMAGAGLRSGLAHGSSDELGYRAVEHPTTVYDFHATVLRLLGIDHKRLTYYHNGIRRRLTDVHGEVIQEILAQDI